MLRKAQFPVPVPVPILPQCVAGNGKQECGVLGGTCEKGQSLGDKSHDSALRPRVSFCSLLLHA